MPGRTDPDEASYRIAVFANTELLTQEPQKEKKPRSVVWTEYEVYLELKWPLGIPTCPRMANTFNAHFPYFYSVLDTGKNRRFF